MSVWTENVIAKFDQKILSGCLKICKIRQGITFFCRTLYILHMVLESPWKVLEFDFDRWARTLILPLLLALTRTITKIFCVDSKENVWRLAFTDNRLWSRSGSSTLEENSRYFGRKFMFFESDAIILQVYICIVDVKKTLKLKYFL